MGHMISYQTGKSNLMKTGQKLWTRDELLLAINLYCKLPFGRLHSRNPEIILLAKMIGRTANSVALKLVNLASLDPSLKARGIKGAQNASKLDRKVWNEFFLNTDSLLYESEKIFAKRKGSTIEAINNIPDDDLARTGTVREQLIRARINQTFFRSALLASYNESCCITGLNQPEFLVAGHIRPWSVDENNRLNPRNGLLLNALHDKAFENGLITVTPDYKVKVSKALKRNPTKVIEEYFLAYENTSIHLPSRFLPDKEFLLYHNEVRFKP